MTESQKEQKLLEIRETLRDWDGIIGHWFWLSFCDADRPRGSQFLGVAIVFAPGDIAAAVIAHGMKVNPGGEVAICELDDASGNYLKAGNWTNRIAATMIQWLGSNVGRFFVEASQKRYLKYEAQEEKAIHEGQRVSD